MRPSTSALRRPSIWRRPRRRAGLPSRLREGVGGWACHAKTGPPLRCCAALPLPQARGRFQRAVPLALIYVDLAHLDPMLARVAHDLGRSVEAHRLRVQQRAGERRGIFPLQPARDVNEVGEARGVAFGKAIFAEALDLVEAALGEFGGRSRAPPSAQPSFPQGLDLALASGTSPSPCAAGWLPRR